MPSLFEKYRPRTWSDIVGQDKAIACLRRLESNGGLAGRAYFLAAPSGVGKTSIARIIGRSVAGGDDFGVDELDGRELTESRLDAIVRTQWQRPLSGGRCVIVNEAHTMRSAVVGRLLTDLEPIPPHFTWVFTTTDDGQAKLIEDMDDFAPLQSRCLIVPMARQGLAEAFAQHVQTIATTAGLNGKPLKNYIRLAQEKRNNMRAMLQAVEAGYMLD